MCRMSYYFATFNTCANIVTNGYTPVWNVVFRGAMGTVNLIMYIVVIVLRFCRLSLYSRSSYE